MYASATGENVRESVVEGTVGVGADRLGPTAVDVGTALEGFGVDVYVTAGTDVAGVDEVVKQLRVPVSVKVLPGSGTKRQS